VPTDAGPSSASMRMVAGAQVTPADQPGGKPALGRTALRVGQLRAGRLRSRSTRHRHRPGRRRQRRQRLLRGPPDGPSGGLVPVRTTWRPATRGPRRSPRLIGGTPYAG
jgi:hypothetical protein